MRIMLSLYRRHRLPRFDGDPKACAHVAKGRSFAKCSCPIWLDGMQDGVRINISLKTRNWTLAAKKLRDIEAGVVAPDRALKPVGEACEDYLAKLTVERKAAPTLDKYRAALIGT